MAAASGEAPGIGPSTTALPRARGVTERSAHVAVKRRRYVLPSAALVVGAVASCGRGPEVVTSLEFDGERRTITTSNVSCARQPDDTVVILVSDGPRRMIRMHIGRHGRITVFKVGLRHEELRGFVADPAEVVGTKVDDTFTARGRMPPNAGETTWHTFTIETSCPFYRDARPNDTVPALGVP